MLEVERELLAEHEEEWSAKHAGQCVLIRGRELVGWFDREEEAVAAGARRFGLTPFLVRRLGVTADEPLVPALTLGAGP